MLILSSDKIYITRGDDGIINVNLTNADGSTYSLSPGDVLRLTVKTRPQSSAPVLVALESTTGQFVLEHATTSTIAAGYYSADIQLTAADGSIYTVWPTLPENMRATEANWKNFIVMPEVTNE